MDVLLGLGLGGSQCFLQQKRWWLASSMEVSSIKITSRRPVWLMPVLHSHLRRFTLFTSHTIWQYSLPPKVPPSVFLHLRIILRYNDYPPFRRIAWSWMAIGPHLPLNNCFTFSVTLGRLLLPGHLAREHVAFTSIKNLVIHLPLPLSPSSLSSSAIFCARL